jgi:methylenetetrahydrofolate reductase (NADPH)
MQTSDTLKQRLDRGEFVITAEIAPRLTASADELLAQAEPLRGRVAAVNVTDGAGARVTMSSLAAAAILARGGIEPIMHMTCRDRNRIGIAADLIGASALGIRNLLVLTGDDPGKGDEPDAKPVYDLDSDDVITVAHRLGAEGKTPSGRELSTPARFFIGAADVPFHPPPEWKPDRLQQKIEAGAGFVQTQFCYQPALTRRYLDRLGEYGILDRLPFLIGIGPLASARSANWMNDNLFGVSVPGSVIDRLENARDPASEGLRICVELIETYRNMPGVAGVHIMAPAQGSDRIAAVLDAAG